ncbi:unnamed protein product [Rhizophagus irregularis]|nr:unnamed protein product [Rhizophagus irregularis]
MEFLRAGCTVMPENRLSAMKMCIHYILHVVASIKRNGPCCITWQFPIELVYVRARQLQSFDLQRLKFSRLLTTKEWLPYRIKLDTTK